MDAIVGLSLQRVGELLRRTPAQPAHSLSKRMEALWMDAVHQCALVLVRSRDWPSLGRQDKRELQSNNSNNTNPHNITPRL